MIDLKLPTQQQMMLPLLQILKAPSRYKYLTNGCGEDTGYWTPGTFRRHQLAFQSAKNPGGVYPFS